LGRFWGNIGRAALAQALIIEPGGTAQPGVVKAEVSLRRAVAYAPEDRSSWRGLGFALAAQRRENEALAAWQLAGNNMAEELVQRGEHARKAGQYEEALTWYKQAAVLAPDSAPPRFYMGLVYEKFEMWDDAIESFQQAERRIGNNEEIADSLYFHLGRLLQKHLEPPNLPAALRLFEAALASDRFISNWERIAAHYHRGDILRRQERLQEAQQEFKWVVSEQPDHYRGHVSLGAVTWQVNDDINEAEKYLKQAIVLEPELKLAYLWLGRIYQQAGHMAEAVEVYRRVLEIDPKDKEALQFFAEHQSDASQSSPR
jgi:tetratricopeptide (TPR) repeat protein